MAAPKKAAVAVHASLNEALLAVQQAMPAFQRNEINPHYGHAYLTLETLLPQVIEVLSANGILLTQEPSYIMSPTAVVPALHTKLTHVATGEACGDNFPLSAKGDGPQNQGAALTYARRYALMSVLGITADKDTDGNVGVSETRAPMADDITFTSGVQRQIGPNDPSPFAPSL